MLLGNSTHVSNVKLERQPANLQLLTSWEVVGVVVDDVIIVYSNYRRIIIAYQMIYDNSTSLIMAFLLNGVLP